MAKHANKRKSQDASGSAKKKAKQQQSEAPPSAPESSVFIFSDAVSGQLQEQQAAPSPISQAESRGKSQRTPTPSSHGSEGKIVKIPQPMPARRALTFPSEKAKDDTPAAAKREERAAANTPQAPGFEYEYIDIVFTALMALIGVIILANAVYSGLVLLSGLLQGAGAPAAPVQMPKSFWDKAYDDVLGVFGYASGAPVAAKAAAKGSPSLLQSIGLVWPRRPPAKAAASSSWWPL